jgi:hypothetical protein
MNVYILSQMNLDHLGDLMAESKEQPIAEETKPLLRKLSTDGEHAIGCLIKTLTLEQNRISTVPVDDRKVFRLKVVALATTIADLTTALGEVEAACTTQELLSSVEKLARCVSAAMSIGEKMGHFALLEAVIASSASLERVVGAYVTTD